MITVLSKIQQLTIAFLRVSLRFRYFLGILLENAAWCLTEYCRTWWS